VDAVKVLLNTAYKIVVQQSSPPVRTLPAATVEQESLPDEELKNGGIASITETFAGT
jgi:hypothetical protein